MQRALITGGTGFIGGHLAEQLIRRGWRVRCLVRSLSRSTRLRELEAELVEGDVTRPETLAKAVADVDVVYHLAGLLAALRPEQMEQVNAQGTAHIADACAEVAAPPILLVVSSLAAAGPVPRGQVRSETDPCQPISWYGQTKRQGELAAARRAGQVPITVVRPGVVFGPHCREIQTMLSTIYRLRVHPVPGWISPPLSYIHVDDLVEIVIRAAERGQRLESRGPRDAPSPRGYYFAEAGEHPDWGQFGRRFARALGRPFAPVLRIPDPLPWMIGAASDLLAQVRGRAEIVNADKMREARASSWACSSDWTHRDLDFLPARSLQERIEQTAAWYLDHRLL